MEHIVKKNEYRYYFLDLYAENLDCPVKNNNEVCGNRNCAVVEDEEYKQTQFGTGEKKCSENDYCFMDRKGVVVSLPENPERFTGYSGPGANILWSSFYGLNIFGYTGDEQQAGNPVMDETISDTEEEDTIASDGVEYRLFYRVVSGFHASVSAHLCYEHLNNETNEWEPSSECWFYRVGKFPDRVNNLYFNYELLRRAIIKVYESTTSFHNDVDVQALVKNKLTMQLNGFSENGLFAASDLSPVKQQLKQQFRKVSGLVDCVGCDRCRLWSKIQITGYATALKVLFEKIEPEQPLERLELVALINTFDKISESVRAAGYFGEISKESSTVHRADTLVPVSLTKLIVKRILGVWNAAAIRAAVIYGALCGDQTTIGTTDL